MQKQIDRNSAFLSTENTIAGLFPAMVFSFVVNYYIRMDQQKAIFITIVVTFFLLFFAGSFWFSWYSAGLQNEVYKRQGVTMSQWEVFMGAKPIERLMNIK